MLSLSLEGRALCDQLRAGLDLLRPGGGWLGCSDFQVGALPTRLARAGNRLFVSLRGQRQVAVLTDNDGAPKVEARIDVGAEP